MGSIAERWRNTQQQVNAAARAAHRDPDDVLILAVSKTFPLDAVESAWQAGARHFGENYVQEAVTKIEACTLPGVVWHFIGPLQSNKTRDVAAHFDWVHTVDREKIARRLNDQRPADAPPLNLCIQVNISDDPAKAGIEPSAAAALAETVSTLPRLRLRGLMTITAQGLSEPELVKQYRAMAELLQGLQQRFSGMDTLSMGMSADMTTAVACGSTCVRIGSAIFGPRTQPGGRH